MKQITKQRIEAYQEWLKQLTEEEANAWEEYEYQAEFEINMALYRAEECEEDDGWMVDWAAVLDNYMNPSSNGFANIADDDLPF